MLKKALSAAALLCSASLPLLAQAPANLVYVETNNPASNAILAFTRGAGGALTQLTGSPFNAGGTGAVDPTFGLTVFSNDTPILANPAHTYVYAVNEGSNTISVFYIASNGSLSPIAGSPFASGGYQPSSLSLNGSILTVVNKNSDPAQAGVEANAQPNYTTFYVAANGALTPTGSSFNAGASPSQSVSIPTSQYNQYASFGYGDRGAYSSLVFGDNFGGGSYQTFQVTPTGTLVANPLATIPTQIYAGRIFQGGPAPALPLGLAVNPNFPVLYSGLVTINDVGVSLFNPQGQLFPLNAVPDPAQGADCWLLINRAGTRLYAVGTAGNTVTTFDITNPINPSPLSVTNLRESGTGRAFEIALSADEQYLYVVGQQDTATSTAADDTLHVLAVSNNGSTLTEVQTPNLSQFVPNTPPLTRWQGVVAF